MSSRSRSESLQILDERPLVGVGQRRAVWVAFVAAIAIAFDVRIENRKCPAFLLGIRRDEADVSQVINVIREIETLHALAGRLQQLPQVRHRTIVQVWSAQPDSVERHARVTVRLSEMIEAMRVILVETPRFLISRIKSALIHCELPRV